MYKTIGVAIDNSPGSGIAEGLAVRIAEASGGSITGIHAYTGRYHRSRFEALEPHLPERYQSQEVLGHQRAIHSVLIGRGLELISAEYMKRLRQRCGRAGVPFAEQIADGKNADILIDASEEYDLMVMGAEGLGQIPGSPGIGSNTRRMLRFGKSDLLVARRETAGKQCLACIDGSAAAFRAAARAANLARILNGSLVIAASFDPFLHKNVFGSLSGVLAADTGNVFRFSEQQELHNRVIDRSLASLYRGFLDRATVIAGEEGVSARHTLLKGKPYHAICAMAETMNADLVIVGRTGMHRGRYGDIGSNAEKIAEYANTNVLVVGDSPPDQAGTGKIVEPSVAAVPSGNGISWDEAAGKRIDRIPPFARPMAVMAIERYARERGIARITPEIMDRARENLGL